MELSSVQKGIWITQLLYPESTLYNVGGYAVIKEYLNEYCLCESIEQVLKDACIIKNYASFIVADESVQSNTSEYFKIQILDFSSHDDPAADSVDWMVSDMKERTFLTNNALVICIIKTSDLSYYWYVKTHHLIFDGFSMYLFFKQVSTVYDGLTKTFPTGEPNAGKYTDFVHNENNFRKSEEYRVNKIFWVDKIREFPSTKAFGSCFDAINENISLKSARKEIIIPREEFKRIEAFCAANSFSVLSYFIGSILVLNNSYNSEKCVIGIPMYNRFGKRFKNILGPFINVIPLYIDGDIFQRSFIDFIRDIKKELMISYRHQKIPFLDIINELDIQGDLYNIIFSYQKNVYKNGFGANDVRINYLSSGEQKEDMVFHLLEYSDTEDIVLAVDYKVSLFPEWLVNKLISHFYDLITSLFLLPDKLIKDIPPISESQKQTLLVDFNDDRRSYPEGVTILDLFSAQVDKGPDRVAVLFGDSVLTYKELDERSDQLASYLVSSYGVKREDLIGVRLERSVDIIIALLGVLKSGGAYVPIDPLYPEERISYMLSDSACKVVLDKVEWDRFLSIGSSSFYFPIVSVKVSPEDLAYVIYTSGSTGAPKGVMVSHGNMSQFIHWCTDEFGGSVFDTVLGVTSICFDLSVFEIFYTLSAGKRLRVLINALSIPQYLHGEGGVLLNTVPGVVGVLLKEGIDLSAVKVLNMAGEPIGGNILEELNYDSTEVRNLYGPTEDTTYSTCYRLFGPGKALIGRPIANTQVDIMSGDLRLAPVGVMGEICIRGAGLSRGYLNNPELTADKFVPHPYLSGHRMYRTGDMGRWLPDGTIEFMGRRDDQVKIRGYRIELGEIEQVLRKQAGIEDAVVIAIKDEGGDKELAAYIVGEEDLEIISIRKGLERQLPDYMLPVHYIKLGHLPRTPNGKIDRKALPGPIGSKLPRERQEDKRPLNKVEEKLVKLWSELLSIPATEISIKDDFLSLGGHSLKIMRLSGLIRQHFEINIGLKELFNCKVLEEQALLIGRSKRVTQSNIIPIEILPHYPLSSVQKRLWILSFLEHSVAYNMPGCYLIEGVLDLSAISYAFNVLIERHEILRTVFRQDSKAEVRQYIKTADESGFSINYHDLRGMEASQEEINQRVSAEVMKPFDLSECPLSRFSILQVGHQRCILIFVIHHIICDGWSINLIVKELFTYYNSYVAGNKNLLPPLRIQYKDYAVWQQSQLLTDDMSSAEAYWMSIFLERPPVLELPIDKARPALRTDAGGRILRIIDGGLLDEFKSLAQDCNCTLYMCLLGLVSALLYRYTGQEDIVLGGVVEGRDDVDLEDQIGCYVNTLALRMRLKGGDSFRAMIQMVREVALGAYEFRAYPFDALVEKLIIPQDVSRNPLFDVMVILQDPDNWKPTEVSFQPENVELNPYNESISTSSKLDLLFTFAEKSEGLEVVIEYNSDLFYHSTMESLLVHLKQLMLSATNNPDRSISDLDLLSKSEELTLIYTFNDTKTFFSEGVTMLDLFFGQVQKRPDEIAVISGTKSLTYKELNIKSNQLATHLGFMHGIGKEDRVGIKLDRSIDMIVALFGVLKSGGAYVPMDPFYPEERINYMLSDSGCKMVLDIEEWKKFEAVAPSYSFSNSLVKPLLTDLAYIIYTSGSTGNPKGVMISHGNLSRFIHWCLDEFKNSLFDTVLGVTSICFDLSIFEIFYTIAAGRKLRVLTNALSIPMYLHGQENILVNTVPSVVDTLLNNMTDLSSVKVLNMAGEAIAGHILERLNCETTEVRNLYGPTEDTTYSTCYRIRSEANGLIGRPIADTQIYILDINLRLLPVGAIGEICIGGGGLAKGYVNKPELTAEKFISHPFAEAKRIYRTGDLGRWLADGTLEFIGRRDAQVKIRGYRIEPGEIERAICRCQGVKNAVVAAMDDDNNETMLVAYLVGDEAIKIPFLRAFLREILPEYMLPSLYVRLDALPLTPNGKVDRKRLPSPERTELSVSGGYVPPTSETEIGLENIWSELLHIKFGFIGIHDDFFALGGHSLKIMRLASSIYNSFQVRVDFKTLFNENTIAKQALIIESSAKIEDIIIQVTHSEDGYLLSHAQQRIWVAVQFSDASYLYNESYALSVEGKFNVDLLEIAIKKLIDKHDILHTVFRENEAGQVRQYIVDPEIFPIKIIVKDLMHTADPDSLIKYYMTQQQASVFDLSKGLLFKVLLLRAGDNKYVLSFTMHHIICDGWSMMVLFHDLMDFYGKLYTGDSIAAAAAAAPFRYIDYVYWEESRMSDNNEYWRAALQSPIPVMQFPYSSPAVVRAGIDGGNVLMTLESPIVESILEFSRTNKVTISSSLFAVYNILLHKFTGQEDFFVGQIAAGRTHPHLDNMAGIFINYLPIRSMLDKTSDIATYVKKFSANNLNALNNQEVPFDILVNQYADISGSGENPLFETVYNFHSELEGLQKIGVREGFATMSGLKITSVARAHISSPLNFKLDITESCGRYDVNFVYKTALFTEEAAFDLVEKYISLVRQVVSSPHLKVEEIEIFSPTERSGMCRMQREGDRFISICASFILDPIKEYMNYWIKEAEMELGVWVAPYNQIFQQLLDLKSDFLSTEGYKVLVFRFEDWIRDIEPENDFLEIPRLDMVLDDLIRILAVLDSQHICVCIGVTESDNRRLTAEKSIALEERLEKYVRASAHLLWIDCRHLPETYSISDIFDHKSDELAHIPYTEEYYSVLGMYITRMVYSLHHSPYKVIVTDCDNTLWKGIVGEDGVNGITIGEEHLSLQRFLLSKREQGFLLVLCSKNDERDIWNVFEQRIDMVLRREHITASKINWSNKSDNIRELALDLNLKESSFIFLDDSPYECEEVERGCPEVLTIQMPENSNEIPRLLKQVWAFDKLKSTVEDLGRNSAYQTEKIRNEYKVRFNNVDDFIRSLGLEINMERMTYRSVARVSQLSKRVNQFNLNGRIMEEDLLTRLQQQNEYDCLLISVKDRFGDYGLAGAITLKHIGHLFTVEGFWLSCRVLGRAVEDEVLKRIIEMAKKKGAVCVELDYKDTGNNAPLKKFLDGNTEIRESVKGNMPRFTIPIGEIQPSNYESITS